MGKAIGVLLWLIAIGSVVLFAGRWWWFPETISEYGPMIDAQFIRTLIVVAIAFVAAQVALGYVVFRYGRRGNERAVYSHGSNKLEATWTIITAAIFISIAILGQRVWAQLHLNQAPADAVKVEVVAQQFQWNFHYGGADKTLGKTNAKLINDGALEFIGLDPSDPASTDDQQVATLAVPVNHPVELTLRSKDVIHSFFVPALRIKQDAVPGMNIRIHFTANKVGKYEIACAELCGNLHYNMKSYMLVLPDDEFNALSAMPGEAFTTRMGELLQQYQ